MAAAEKLDQSLEEAAKSLGAPPYRIVIDIIIPALKPGLIASGAIVLPLPWVPSERHLH